ncbi:MAG: helix-turn-helix transcriptional regulator [Actinomycetota bacterium]
MPPVRPVDREFLLDLLSHEPVLRTLHVKPLSHGDLKALLGVSTATVYRYSSWLDEQGVATLADDSIELTPLGIAVSRAVSEFDEAVREALDSGAPDLLVEVTKLAPGIQALSNRPLDRRDLEERIDVSKTTGYRITRSLEEHGLVERVGRSYELTCSGTEVLQATSRFEGTVRLAFRLGPALAPLQASDASVDIEAFADATVTSVYGYVHGPVNRFLALLDETTTLRGLAVSRVAPFYLGEIQERLAEGLVFEQILRPEFVARQLAEFPDRAIEVCDSDNVTVFVHDDLWFSLVLFDDRIGIGVSDAESGTLEALVDTGSASARDWAEAVYESYRSQAVRLPRFDPISLQEALDEELLPDGSAFKS